MSVKIRMEVEEFDLNGQKIKAYIWVGNKHIKIFDDITNIDDFFSALRKLIGLHDLANSLEQSANDILGTKSAEASVYIKGG